MKRLVLAVVAALSFAGAGHAAVVDKGAYGFRIKTVQQVAAPPEKVWKAIGEWGRWWSDEHTYSGKASNIALVLQAGGCLCEVLPGGGSVRHGVTELVIPNKTLRLDAAFGPLQDEPAASTETPMLDLGSYPLHAISDMFTFDLATHLRYDIVAPRGPISRDLPLLDKVQLDPAIAWLLGGIPKMQPDLSHAVTAPLRLTLTGPAGRGTLIYRPVRRALTNRPSPYPLPLFAPAALGGEEATWACRSRRRTSAASGPRPARPRCSARPR
jgi:hypothetical protein